jgi:ferredoxin
LVGDHAEISEDCRGCGRCVDACPNYAIELTVDEADYWKLTVDRITSLVNLT